MLTVSLKWDSPRPRNIAASLVRDSRRLMVEARKQVQKNAALTAAELRRTTPRDRRRRGRHIASGWTTRRLEPPTRLGVAFEVYNKDPRAEEPRPYSGGVGSLLTFLEYGVVRHEITPKDPDGFLRFYWVRESRWVTTKKVNHPGFKPFGMMAAATDSATRGAQLTIKNLASAWSRPSTKGGRS